MNFVKRKNTKGDKILFYYDFGRKPGQRPTTGIFLYTKPKNQIERNHNKEALMLLDVKKSELTLEKQATGSAFIPSHKIKTNFIDYYEEYISLNRRKANRHLINSLKQFRLFVHRDFIAPLDITENLCKRFRQFLLDKFTGETPGNYFARFKWVVTAAHKDGYFRINPVAEVQSKSNPSKRIKENLEADDYIRLLTTPFWNQEIQDAFIFSCYTGLRWVDVKYLEWSSIKPGSITTRIIQKKTGLPVELTLHPIAQSILDKRAQYNYGEKVFNLPDHDGANKALSLWLKTTGIKKHITWSCARLSFSILLKDQNVDDVTIAYLMGHSSTEQVQKTYKRHRPKDQSISIKNLPNITKLHH